MPMWREEGGNVPYSLPEGLMDTTRCPNFDNTVPLGGARRRGSVLSSLLAFLALVVALLALFLALFRDPLGPATRMNWHAFDSSLSGYDFSTPAAAYKSNLVMQEKRDIRAVMEYDRRVREKELKEKIDTLDVKKEVD